MDKRTALRKETELNFENQNGAVSFMIDSEIGRGASSIAYEAYYLNNSNQKKRVIIKECYPYYLDIIRNLDGSLSVASDKQNVGDSQLISSTEYSSNADCDHSVSSDEASGFENEKELFRRSFEVENSLYEDIETNSLINFLNIYEKNNTVYTVSEKIFGKSLTKCLDESLKNKVTYVISTAKTIKKIHDAGFLYLDIKPDNIMSFDETPEIVKLFDFDSLVPMNEIENALEYRLSFTRGFSAPELVRGDRRKISKATDVYGIGALLFFCIFGETPDASASEKDAVFDFDLLKNQEGIYNQKLYSLITEFFHRTLSNYIPDRFQDFSDAITLLQKTVSVFDKEKLFLNSFGLYGQEVLIGREKEIHELSNFLECQNATSFAYANYVSANDAFQSNIYRSEKNEIFQKEPQYQETKYFDGNVIFLTGPRYIGRSAIVRFFLSENREAFDNIIYVNYTGSLLSMINDDNIFMVNGLERTVNDSDEAYFAEKTRALSKILKSENDVLVLCNYDRFDENLDRIINLGWKVIITTEEKALSEGFKRIDVGPLNIEEAEALFHYHLSRDISFAEKQALQDLLPEINYHPFAVELIAKSVKAKDISLTEALRQMNIEGFSNIAREKISVSENGKYAHESVKNILYHLVDSADLDEETHLVLKFASLFENGGIVIKDTMELFSLETRDAFNFLLERKWAYLSNGRFILESFYLEMARSMHWTDEEIIQLNAIIDEISSYIDGNGELYQNPDHQNQEQYMDHLEFARQLIKSFSIDEIFCKSEKFLRLLDTTIINLPTEYDNFIIEKGTWRITQTVLTNPSRDHEIFDKIVDAYLLKGEPDKAFETTELMRKYYEGLDEKLDTNASKQNRNDGMKIIPAKLQKVPLNEQSVDWLMGYYYESLSSIYDFLVDGNYSEDSQNLKLLFSSIENAIKYFSKSNEKHARISDARLTLGKVNVMIRSGKYDDRKLMLGTMLHSTEQVIKKDAPHYSLETLGLHMVSGWYYTYIVPNFEKLNENINAAGEIADQIFAGRLIYLEQYAIPAANMYLESGNPDEAKNILNQSMDYCKSLVQSDSVIRAEYNILHYFLDCETNDAEFEKIQNEIQSFEEENRDALNVQIND